MELRVVKSGEGEVVMLKSGEAEVLSNPIMSSHNAVFIASGMHVISDSWLADDYPSNRRQ